MTSHDVVVAGGGPTGLMLAAELCLAGVDALVVERRESQALESARAGGLHARTLEVLEQRGVLDRFLAEGQMHPFLGYAGTFLDIGDLPTRHGMLALWQRDFERILGGWVLDELGVAIVRGRDVVGLTQDERGVDVALSDGSTVRGQYLAGCDGGRSLVRKAAGVDFPGFDASVSFLIAEVVMTEEPPVGMRPEGGGIGPRDRVAGGNPYGVVLKEVETEHRDEPTLDDVRRRLVELYGTDFGAHNPTYVSRFTDMSRQAATYRAGRVFLAGDAAHVHGPFGGQGLNVGVQDAVNLGWKLARVVRGASPDTLLDTYHAERRPVGARVIQNTMAQAALSHLDDRSQALRATVLDLLTLDEPRQRTAAMIAGLDVHYDLGAGHPLLGRRMPDLDLRTADGPTTVFALLHEARPVLVVFAGDPVDDLGAGVTIVPAEGGDPWSVPLVGEVPAVDAVLIRPDGHVVWAGDPGDPALRAAAAAWFGSPRG